MIENFKRILVLAPHTDDGELGCGATLVKAIAAGAEVHYAAFSLARDSVPEGFPDDILATEVVQATGELGIPSDNVHVFDYPVRRLNEHRQDILEDMVRLRKKIQPDLVFLPTLQDVHQDHDVIAREGIRAFKKTSIFAYELIWNMMEQKQTAFHQVEEAQLKKKIKALSRYESQIVKNAGYLDEEFIYGLARVRGQQIGVKYAEAFEVIRWVF